MKKLSFLILVILLVAVTSSATAMTLQVGDFRMQTTDWSFFDDPIPIGGPVPASGNIWSVFRIDNIADANGNVYWQSGDNGQYLAGVLGGLTLNTAPLTVDPGPGPSLTPGGSPTGYHVSVPGAGGVDQEWIDLAIQHNAYFAASQAQGPAYVEVFSSNEDDFIGSATDGFETGPGAGLGASGTFGGDILTGTPWLSATFFNALALAIDDGFLSDGADGATDLYRATTLSRTTAQTTGYLDVDPTVGIGATVDTNGLLGGSDMKITATIDTRDPNNPAFEGWNGQSSGQIFGAAVPEPTTILLLGVGLLGIAGISRKKTG